jgi:hypothetical protein
MIFVVWIGKSFQHAVKTVDSAAVFRWTRELSARALGVGHTRFGRQNLLNGERMLPTVAEIIDIARLCPDLVQHLSEACVVLVERGRFAHKRFVRIGNAEPALANEELVQVVVLPAQGGLHRVM